MLDRQTLEHLARAPEKNAPMLNVALAEEGTAEALLSLARAHGVGPEALAVIAERVAKEGAAVGRDPKAPADEGAPSAAPELDRLLILHPRSPDAVRDAVLARHEDEAFFVLAAAVHPWATAGALTRAVDWPSASPVHDRLWLSLIDGAAVPPLTLEEWAQDPDPLRREAAARIGKDAALLATLARDPARQVRRAVASNRAAAAERARMAEDDPAPEVRARAAGPLSPLVEAAEAGTSLAESARFAAALRAMATHGVLAPDVVRALSGKGAALDDEGARLAAQVLPRDELLALLDRALDHGVEGALCRCLGAGLGLRPRAPHGAEDEAAEELLHIELVYDAVKALTRTTTAESRLTGKARFSSWVAEALFAAPLAGGAALDGRRMLRDLGRRSVGGERMILARGLAQKSAMLADLCQAAADAEDVPPALLELGWEDPSIPEATLLAMAARIARPRKRAEDLPEDEVDFDPARRPLPWLERIVLSTIARANVSPRAALAVVALDARRVRYVLAALPQWKGRLTGGRLGRVLRQHAGALSVAQAEARARVAKVEPWTERLMSELEAGVALAVGHLTGAEVARRIGIGRQGLDDGIALAMGAEARAALEGPAAVQPIVEWAGKNRTTLGPALAIWLLLERLDRERGPTLVASSIDSLASGKGVMPPSVIDALALTEQRRPGRLETIHPQSPRGRAALASAIARAYRAVGGMRDERQG
ncbi:MAG: hypothetical protein U0359_20405 [Byssovorax sp.]